MNRLLTLLLGLGVAGAGLLLVGLAILSLVYIGDQPRPVAPLILTFTMASGMLCLGLMVLRSYAFETSFDNNGIKMQFVFREDQMSWESVEWHKNVGFRNRILGGANVYTILKYKCATKSGDHARLAVLLVTETTGPAVGMSTNEFKTPLDSFMPHKHLNTFGAKK